MKSLRIIRIFLKLGSLNILRVLIFKLLKSFGFYRQVCSIKVIEDKIFFNEESIHTSEREDGELLRFADDLLDGFYYLFHTKRIDVTQDVKWLQNPITKTELDNNQHWTLSSCKEDIKLYWDISRFNFFPLIACAYSKTGEKKYITYLNKTMHSWNVSNPINKGINWCDGQEAAIRVIHLLQTQFILKTPPEKGLKDFIYESIKRINATTIYAEAQLNNHILSESLALFIGSLWLRENDYRDKSLLKVQNKGKRLFETYLLKLIQNDGSFAMYSTNYHRVVMQLVNFYIYSQKCLLKNYEIEKSIRNKLEIFLEWCFQLTDPISGNAPNLGNNDGSYLCKLNTLSYEDFRNSINLLNFNLNNSIIYKDTEFTQDISNLYGIYNFKVREKSFKSTYFKESGIIKTVQDSYWFTLKVPNFNFRPSQWDHLHIDLWVNGQNILTDKGTYSYQASNEYDLSKSLEHNTISPKGFIEPKIGQFLYGFWPKAKVSIDSDTIKASYLNNNGVTLTRKINFDQSCIKVFDNAENSPHAFVTNFNISKNLSCNEFIEKYKFNTKNCLLKTGKSLWTNSYYNDHAIEFIRLESTHDSPLEWSIQIP